MVLKLIYFILLILFSKFVFAQQSLSIHFDISNCKENNNGFIGVNMLGGNPPYRYQWNHTNDTSSRLNNLQSGTYVVTVCDASGSTVSSFANIRFERKDETLTGEIFKVITAIESELIVIQAQQLVTKRYKIKLICAQKGVVILKDLLPGATICYLEINTLYDGKYTLQIVDDDKNIIFTYPIKIQRE